MYHFCISPSVEFTDENILMRYLALASDYDDTLAKKGQLTDTTLRALERFRSSGRKLILVTGREFYDLQAVCPHLKLFDLIVSENGAIMINPSGDQNRIIRLAKAPPSTFVSELKKEKVSPLACGDVIVATLAPHSGTVRSCIEKLGLDLQVIMNKQSLMILPTGTNKGTGLRHALNALNTPASATWAIGDAENDLDLLREAGFGAAVSNALPSIKERASFVSRSEAGQGVEELIDWILKEDS